METITVAFNIDGQYVMPMTVALRSAAEHLSDGYNLHAVILHQGISDANKAKAEQSMEGLRVRITWHDVQLPEGLFTMQSYPAGVPATYFKLYMAEAIAPPVQRAIYLDADMVVCGDLSRLWHVDLEGFPVAAVADTRWQSERLRLLQIPDAPFKNDSDYFNCGVMVVDLAQWRGMHIIERASHYANAYRKDLWLVDQDLLNCIFNGRCKILPPEWNFFEFYNSVYRKYWPEISGAYTLDTLESAAMSPAIIHYGGFEKPWTASTPIHDRQPFVDTYSRTQWAQETLPAMRGSASMIRHQRVLTPMLKVMYREAETGRYRLSLAKDIMRYIMRHPKALLVMPRILLPNLYWAMRSCIMPRLHKNVSQENHTGQAGC